jgi:hypothetical protein
VGDQISLPRRREIDAFLAKQRLQVQVSRGRGRLIFALDATASRQPTWDLACALQAQMFEEATRIGSLDIQLVFYRGCRECSASRWLSDANMLASLMSKIDCRAGQSQIGKILSHARKEDALQKVQAMVFVGDSVEETPTDLYAVARELTMPVFLFQEGGNTSATPTFCEIARLTRGAHVRLDQDAAKQLGELLRAVAAFAAGGLTALSELSGNASAIKLLEQIRHL